jgi:leucyl-tRNA synthetase
MTSPDQPTPASPPATPAPPATADDPAARLAHRYDASLARDIEARWQAAWEAADCFRAPNPGDADFDGSRPKFYCLDMFPYPSGAGLHVGHPEGYTATDILCRYKRMRGFNVLHAMGWDAFGLPAEQYAIQTGVHPAVTTRKAIDNFRRQLKLFGFSYDWDREFATIDPGYYKWTQWIWLQCYEAWYDPRVDAARPIAELEADLDAGRLLLDDDDRPVAAEAIGTDHAAALARWTGRDVDGRRAILDDHRLAYLGEQTVNWCPKLGTALANEEVIDGRSERGSFPVYRKPLRQWMFRITAYAERLLAGLDDVKWPESTRTMQREWIGRSEGAELRFDFENPPAALAAAGDTHLEVFTTRPDTIGGATYMVVAPEHPLVEAVLADPPATTDVAAVRAYVEAARNRADVDRMADGDTKTGVDTGIRAINPATGASIPVWTADYVLMGYGTGAIMAVPAHDDRDYAFARAFELPIVDVVHGPEQAALRRGTERLLADPAAVPADERLAVLAAFVAATTAGDAGADADADDAAWAEACRTHGSSAPKKGRKRLAALATAAIAAPGPAGGQDANAAPDDDGALALARTARAFRLAELEGVAHTAAGVAVNSHPGGPALDGLATAAAREAAIDWVTERGIGRRRVNFRLRDWLFSRQRYWGEPFPVVFDPDGHHHPVGDAHLPVELPELVDYEPVESDVPVPLLAKATDWVTTTAGAAGVSPDRLPPDTPVQRETNTMPGWAGSCWYYLRFCDPHNDERFISREAERAWLLSRRGDEAGTPEAGETWDADRHHRGGVDLYVGGAEHAVLHLLYARFWHKVLFDLGEVATPEPFGRLFHQGMITSHAFQRTSDRVLVAVDAVTERPAADGGEPTYVETATGEPVTRVIAKMSKSLRNVINPDDVIADYGADTFRLYEMYMGPLDASKPWNTQDIAGPFRFLQRAWRLAVDESTGELRTADAANDDIETRLHRTIDKVGGDIERLAFNTGIAAMIEFVNEATKAGPLTADQLARFVICLAPFAPHLAEELWSRLGRDGLVATQDWPEVDASRLKDDTIELPVQINGKVRGRISVPADADQAAIETLAKAEPAVATQLDSMTIRKIIVVPGRIVNIIAS